MRGPLGPSEQASLVTLRVRRYLCRGCGAVATVLPRGVAARRQYAATAIGLALFLLGVVGLAMRKVRERVSPLALSFEAGAWATVRRWVRAIEQGLLFGSIRASPAGFSIRKRAERAAMTLVAIAPPGLGAGEAAVMAGAERAA